MTARFTTDLPLALSTSWVERRAETRAAAKAIRKAEVEIDASLSAGLWPTLPPPDRLAKLEKIWRENMASRAAAAKQYGEPKTSHEFYAGRPGSQAETIVLDCLRALQKLPEIDRLYADQLAFEISKVYVGKSPDGIVERRRTTQLLEIGVETAHGL